MVSNNCNFEVVNEISIVEKNISIMKNTIKIIAFTAFAAMLTWGCSKNSGPESKLSLKDAMSQSAQDLNTAVDVIASSKAFTIFTMKEGLLKSDNPGDSTFRVYIPLEKIKGVYDFKPVKKFDLFGMSLIKYFKKTDDNSRMIVRMPLEKVTNPRSLRHYSDKDTSLVNNFTISVSDYHNNFNGFWDYDYALASEISIDNEVAGNLKIKSLVSPKKRIDYASQYAFTGSYTADYVMQSGDTASSSFSISGGGKVLYEEKLLSVKNDTSLFHRERQYILTVGDVQITRNSSTRKVEVRVNGVLQPNAVVTIVDRESDDEASVCKKRDIQITFEDGTTTTVSALIGKSIDNIKTLFESLHQVYFAANVVDWIAYDIYFNRS
jgi:hypothetical protein